MDVVHYYFASYFVRRKGTSPELCSVGLGCAGPVSFSLFQVKIFKHTLKSKEQYSENLAICVEVYVAIYMGFCGYMCVSVYMGDE